jgi:hypothetical protein
MKECAYCGRDNEDAAECCRECGTTEFKGDAGEVRPPAVASFGSRGSKRQDSDKASCRIKCREDCRTLEEFYPEPHMRQKVHYFFVHGFLPRDVHRNPFGFFIGLFDRNFPGGPDEPTRSIQAHWEKFERQVGLAEYPRDIFSGGMVFRRVIDLTMSLHELAGRPCALVQMPLPESPLQAFFVAVVLMVSSTQTETWLRDARARVFTLEARVVEGPVEGQAGVVCERGSSGSHLNHGVGALPERDAFLEAVARLLQAS